MNDTVIVLVAVLFAGMGVFALVTPASIYALFGVEGTTPDVRNEARAVYGGFGLAIAVLLFAALGSDDVREGIVLTVGVALGGMCAGRLVGAAVERPKAFYPIWFFALSEAVGAAALIAASS